MRTTLAGAACLVLGAAGCVPAPAPDSAGADPWEAARARGIDYRALGQEPGWFLEIDHGATFHLFYDYGEREVNGAAPAPVIEGARTVYQIALPEPVRVVIERRPCADSMSGLPFPDTVTVTIDGRELHGCGQRL